ncbi:MAG: DUF5678 domain-containing protein [Candidatus Jorgensenbacteria bacterium]
MAIDWTKTYKKYRGLWVALLGDGRTIVGSGKTLREALRQADKKGHKDPIVMRMPTEIVPYVGGLWL